MLDYRLLEALAAVVEEGGFERAARRLNITQSAVSQRIRQLEGEFGQPVLARTQPPEPTPAGLRLLRHVRRVGQLEADLGRAFEGREGTAHWRTLAVGVNADSLATWFVEAVLPLATQDRIALDVKVDDQERTHELLRTGEVVGCVSTRENAMRGCRVAFLGAMRYHCVCTPHFASHWFPSGLDAVAAGQAPAVVFNRHDTVHDRFLADRLGESPPQAPRHHCPDSLRFVDFVLRGAGYGMVPHLQAREPLAQGRLLDLSPDRAMQVRLYWHCWNIQSPLLTRLARALRQAALRELEQDSQPTTQQHEITQK